MTATKTLPIPKFLKEKWPAPHAFIQNSRDQARAILKGSDPKTVLIIGPCSIHDPKSAIDYGKKLKELSSRLTHFFPIMRLFIEKPRTLVGWKGIIYDPFLDSSNDIGSGLEIARKLWIKLAEMGIPCATELLDPLVTAYFDDLIIWGLIGARTSASQPHRQLASGFKFPVGFKNDFRGEIDASIAGILSSRISHSHLGIDSEGMVSEIITQGNPLTHLVLRGSDNQTNFDPESVNKTLEELQLNGLEKRLLIDCSHGNSGKDHTKQKIAFESVIEQILSGNRGILGMMLESHLQSGKQPMGSPLQYGVSITDSCIGWEETESLLLSADKLLSKILL